MYLNRLKKLFIFERYEEKLCDMWMLGGESFTLLLTLIPFHSTDPKAPQPIYFLCLFLEFKASPCAYVSQKYRLSFQLLSTTTLGVIHILNVKRPHER